MTPLNKIGALSKLLGTLLWLGWEQGVTGTGRSCLKDFVLKLLLSCRFSADINWDNLTTVKLHILVMETELLIL